jgi:hypothetical protein
MIKIYQCYYEKSQLEFLDEAFIPFDNTINEDTLLEYSLLKKIYSFADSEYWGMVSWRWKEKTNLPGEKFIRWIEENPGYDLYHCHSYLMNLKNFKNSVLDGDYWHAGLKSTMTKICQKLNYNINFDTLVYPKNLHIYAHQYIGSKKFWDLWIPFMDNVVDICRNDEELNRFMFISTTIHRAHNHMINFPFLIERLVSVFLYIQKLKGEEFKILNYPYDDVEYLKEAVFNNNKWNREVGYEQTIEYVNARE